MTQDPWQPPTEPWAPDETETQWVRSGPLEAEEAATTTVPTVPAGATTSAAHAPAAPSKPARPANTDFHRLRLAAQIGCPVLLIAGLTWSDDGTDGWHSTTAWAIFAAVCAVLQLAPLAGSRRGLRLSAETGWFFAAVGTAGLAAYWLVVVLPDASSDAGFLLSLATWLAVVGTWLTPGGHRPIR